MATSTLEGAAGVPVPRARQTSLWTRLAYGLGNGAMGVKDNGFSYFLLLFYSQVIGLDARLVGLALTVALVVDAFVDPMVGYWSDNVRSRFGRRHPFMYASAIPLAALYFILWNPPTGLPQAQLFAFLLGVAVAIRLCVSLYQVPSNALAAELTQDYDERSTLLSFRFFFAWAVGNAMSVLMFAALFPLFVTAAIHNGQFNREAYRVYGLIASGLLFALVMISALGTHSRIPHLKPPPAQRRLTVAKVFREIFETLSNRSFIVLFIASALGTVAAGLSAPLAFYWLTYFWHFTARQSSLVIMGVFASAFIGSSLAPVVTRHLGKKRGAILIGLIAFLGSPMPIVLRLTGILPDNGSPLIFWFIFFTNMFDVALIICFQILSYSMIADLVEQSELKTGRRSEGVFASATTFTEKLVNGVGLIMAGFILTLAGIKTGADASHVTPAALWRLGAIYVPTILTLWMAMVAVIGAYGITRESHAANLRTLAGRQAIGLDGQPVE
ncbi:MAG TPA: MFS transporter [Phenylobacterium sp.]|nr:MFS transporter [Phenylobacterium sp.]